MPTYIIIIFCVCIPLVLFATIFVSRNNIDRTGQEDDPAIFPAIFLIAFIMLLLFSLLEVCE